MSKEMVEIPRWVIDKAINALRLNYNNIDCECCLKRTTASAYNLLKEYAKDETNEEEVRKIIVDYIDGRLKT